MRLQAKTCRKKSFSERRSSIFLTILVIPNNLTLGKSQKQNNFKPICHLFLFNFHFKLLFELKAVFQRSSFNLHLFKRMIFKMERKNSTHMQKSVECKCHYIIFSPSFNSSYFLQIYINTYK